MKILDCSKYLSVDNGKGLLLRQEDATILNYYKIIYSNYNNLNDLILVVGKYIDEHYDEDIEDLEEVLDHLMEIHYYYEIKK